MTVNRDPGTLRGQGVDDDGNALTRAVVESELAHASIDGNAYSWTSITQALIADETGLFLKNIDSKGLHLEGAWLSVDTDTRVIIHYPTVEVTSPSGVAIADVNINTGEPSDGDRAVAMTDEVNNALGDTIWSGEIMAAANPFYVDLHGAARLIKNRSVAIDVVGSVGAFDFVLHAHFEG